MNESTVSDAKQSEAGVAASQPPSARSAHQPTQQQQRQASTSTALPEYEPRDGQAYSETKDEPQQKPGQEPSQPVIFTESPRGSVEGDDQDRKSDHTQMPADLPQVQVFSESPTGSADDLHPQDPSGSPQGPPQPPLLERLPSESLSMDSSSSSSSDSAHEGAPPAVPRQASAKRAKPPPLAPSPNQQAKDASQRLFAHAPSPNALQISEPSTPAGFMRHRHSSSLNQSQQVRETLNAFMANSDDADEEQPPSEEGHSTLEEAASPVDRKRRINQYRIGKMLGKGSAASVFAAQDDTGAGFACKEFSKSQLRRRKKSELLRTRRGRRAGPSMSSLDQEEKDDPLVLIRTEIAVMKKLYHPYLVKLHEVLDAPDSDSLFMSMLL